MCVVRTNLTSADNADIREEWKLGDLVDLQILFVSKKSDQVYAAVNKKRLAPKARVELPFLCIEGRVGKKKTMTLIRVALNAYAFLDF